MAKGPKVLFADIETSPIVSYTWGIWDQNIGLNQIKEDWSILAYCAKWRGSSKLYYADQRHAKVLRDERKLLKGIWQLLDECDILITQNGKKFDAPKLNARFIMHGMKPPSSYRHIDTRLLARKNFGFTSNSLEYLAKALKCKHQKLVDREYVGQELWNACLDRDQKAWKEMERYNKQDVLVLEEVYEKLAPWGTGVNMDVYSKGTANTCSCGSGDWIRYGMAYTATGRFQRYQCRVCGSETRGRENLLAKSKKKSLRAGR